MNGKISPKEWLAQNKGKTINDYFKQFPEPTSRTPDSSASHSPAPLVESSDDSISKDSWVNIVVAVIGIIGFFLPWFQIAMMGQTVTSMSGYTIPKVFGGLMQFSMYMDNGTTSGGFNEMYILYLIPLVLLIIAYGEFTSKKVYSFFLSLISLASIGFFSYRILSVVEINQILNFLGIGIYLTIGSSIILFFRKIGG